MEFTESQLFDGLFVEAEGVLYPVDVIGIIKEGQEKYVVVSELKPFGIKPGEYGILRLLVDEGSNKVSFEHIEDDELYEGLVTRWEEAMQ